jgi:hypothetical protein
MPMHDFDWFKRGDDRDFNGGEGREGEGRKII